MIIDELFLVGGWVESLQTGKNMKGDVRNRAKEEKLSSFP